VTGTSAKSGATTKDTSANTSAKTGNAGAASKAAKPQSAKAAPAKDAPAKAAPATAAKSDYSAWTKAQLYEKATELNVKGRSGMDKTELIEAIQKAE
jgi:DNA end-binding protein Ku